MPNAFTHAELSSTSVAAAKEFYGALFDWKLQDVPGMEYTMVETGKGHGGGIMPHPMPEQGSFWLTYIDVADINAATEKAAHLGGRIMRAPREVMGAGWVSVIVDPTGAVFGLWQGK